MPGRIKTRNDELETAELAELEALLLAHRRSRRGEVVVGFRSDEADVVVWYGLLILGALGGLIAILLEMTPAADLVAFIDDLGPDLGAIGRDITTNWSGPVSLLAIGAVLWSAWSWFRARGRCGEALLSTGFARLRGKRLRYLRYRDVKSYRRGSFTTGRSGDAYGREVSYIELAAEAGGSLTSYYFASAIAGRVDAARATPAARPAPTARPASS